jgi:hypothetical protein
MISNETLWDVTNQQLTGNQIKERKWSWTGHTLRKTEGAIERAALDWNPQDARRQGRPRKSCRDGKDLEGSEEIGQQSYSMEMCHRCPMLQLGATGN